MKSFSLPEQAAAKRRSELKLQPELVAKSAKPVERRLIRMLAESEGFRQELAQRLQNASRSGDFTSPSPLYRGLETEKIFAALVLASLSGQPVQAPRSPPCSKSATAACSSRFCLKKPVNRPGRKP